MKRRQLSKKDVKEINETLEKEFSVKELLDKKTNAEVIDDRFIKINRETMFFYLDGKVIPTLKNILKNNFLKKITVDMGAVKFVVKGADIMRPGIVEIENGIKQNETISIVDQNNKKPIAVGIALLNSEDMKNTKEGKVIKNIHYVGDEIWTSY